MKFLNKKEQVLDIQLTEYGKRLLSKGRFKPTYYSFFDDGILYDSQYAGVSETQNDAQQRIIKDTPRLGAQAIHDGAESNVLRQNELIRSLPKKGNMAPTPGVLELIDQGQDYQNTTDKLFSLVYPLGTSQLTSKDLPYWKVNFLRGKTSGSLSFINSVTCSNQILNIPQISTEPITYQTRVEDLTALEAENTSRIELYGQQSITVLEDDSAILLEILEENADFDHENFEIEIYEIKEVTDTNIGTCQPNHKVEELIPLYFTKPKPNIVDGILLDIDERDEIFENPNLELDSSYVEYFFDIDVDNEIDKDIICKFAKNAGEGIFSQKVLDCEPEKFKRKMSPSNLFNTDTEGEDCGE